MRREARRRYLEEGEKAHSWAEYYLRKELFGCGYDEDDAVPPKVGKTPEIEQGGKKYAEYVVDVYRKEKMAYDKSLIRVEICLDCSNYAENCLGTPDAFVVGEKTIHVIDYKYGEIPVEPKKNTQLMIYGLAILSTYKEILGKLEQIQIVIFQPRNGGAKKWAISTEELTKWGKEVLRPSAERALLPYKESFVGNWCKYCKGKEYCVEFQGYERYGYMPSFQKVSDNELKEMKKRVLRVEKICGTFGKGSNEAISELQGDIEIMNKMVDKYKYILERLNEEETTRIYDDKRPLFIFNEYKGD